MTFDVQYLFNLAIGALSVAFGYLFTMCNTLEKRVQRLEDVQGTAVNELKNDIKEMESKIDKLTEKVTNLAYNVHANKNAENQLNNTLTAILKHLQHHEKTD